MEKIEVNENKAFVIAYPGGGCGSFIATCISYLIGDYSGSNTFPNCHAHNTFHNINFNFKLTESFSLKYPPLEGWGFNEQHDMINNCYPIDKERAVIVKQHAMPDINQLKTNWPNHHLIVVNYSNRDLTILNALRLVKISKWRNNNLQFIRSKFAEYAEDYTDIDHIPIENFKQMVRKQGPIHPMYQDIDISKIPTQQVILINFREIFFNRQRFVIQLETITGKKADVGFFKMYQNYLDSHYQNEKLKAALEYKFL